jgi:formate dehydrogenase maturation protein FdhE
MSDTSRWMSPEGYVATGGELCPCCGSRALSSGPLRQIEAQEVARPVACLTCQAGWLAVFELRGYEGATEAETSLC